MIAGVDEAGRGALAGPVVAASVILDPKLSVSLFKDSKQLTAQKRAALYAILRQSDSLIGLGVHSAAYVDRYNILRATMSAMRRSVLALKQVPNEVLVDGNRVPDLGRISVRSIVQGDRLIPEISAASIVAKVVRDRMMDSLDSKFPSYGFLVHKGYGTEAHYEAIFSHGILSIHRRSFNLTRQGVLF